MNRRSFLKILPAMAALGTWITVRPSINPAWINAPYEAHFLFGKGNAAYHGIAFGIDPQPLRVKL